MKHVDPSAALESMPVPVCIVGRDRRILYLSAACASLLGVADRTAAITGSALSSVIDPVGAEMLTTIVGEILDRPGEGIREFDLLYSRHGSPARVSGAADALVVRGEAAGAVIVFWPRREAQTAERTPDDREAARLEVARQLAVTLNHEINNPLFIVSATLEDLQSETTDPQLQRRLNAALDAVWKVSSAVKQLSEIRQIVSTAYITGYPMIDLEASQERPDKGS